MIDNFSLHQTIDMLSDGEIIERIKGNYYSDDALSIAKEILVKRGVPVPEVEEGYIKPKFKFRESHPIWYWTFVGAGVTMVLRLIKQLLN